MKINDLEKHEQDTFGGLVRMMLRADGDFSEQEEERINEIGEELGGASLMWRLISNSAQALPKDEQIRESVDSVTRPVARHLILDVIGGIAASDGVDTAELELVDWVRHVWQ